MQIRKESEISLLLTDNNKIQELNYVYRKIDKPTDVLAFSLLEKSDLDKVKNNSIFEYEFEYEDFLLGDIVISIETAKAQSEKYGHSLYHELTILMIHGLLHLLGYDHIQKEDAGEMRREEKRILDYINQKEMI